MLKLSPRPKKRILNRPPSTSRGYNMAGKPSRPTVPLKLVYLAPNMKHTVHALLNFWSPVSYRINHIMVGEYRKIFQHAHFPIFTDYTWEYW